MVAGDYECVTDDDLPEFTPEELAELATGPGLFAREWVGAVLADDVVPAWALLSEEFRLALAQMWIYHNPAVLADPRAGGLDRDRLAERLLRADPDDGLFVNMRMVEIRTIRQSLGGVLLDQLGTGSRPRLIDVDLELVHLFYLPDLDVDDRGQRVFKPGAFARSVSVVVAGSDGSRRVAGFGEHLLRPGWPPVHERIIGPAD